MASRFDFGARTRLQAKRSVSHTGRLEKNVITSEKRASACTVSLFFFVVFLSLTVQKNTIRL